MELEHPGIEKFEPTLQGLMPLVFEAGISALQKSGQVSAPKDVIKVIEKDRAAYRRFIRGCHYGWDLAQRKIAALLIEYAKRNRVLASEVKTDLRSRNIADAKEKRDLMSCLEGRQIVLRRLADSILYHLIEMQHWVLRRTSLEYKIRPIDPVILAETVSTATELNREERLKFSLVSDLTTGVHVGDLIQGDFTVSPPAWRLVELKSGKMNAILDKFIATAEGELPPEQLQQIQDQFGEKAVSQAKRMARQKWRQDEVMRVIETDEGIDIQHETPIRLTPEAVEVDDYQQTVVDLCGKASAAGVSAATINRCLRIVAIRGEEYRSLGPMGVAHFFYHLQP